MQHIIEELLRWIGFAALWLLTFGRYRGGTAGDRLPEGAIGLTVVIALTCVAYALGS